MLTIGEMRNMTEKELAQELKVAKHNLFKYRFTVRAGTEKSIHLLKKWKTQVAQVETVLKELQSGEKVQTSKKQKKVKENKVEKKEVKKVKA